MCQRLCEKLMMLSLKGMVHVCLLLDCMARHNHVNISDIQQFRDVVHYSLKYYIRYSTGLYGTLFYIQSTI